MSALGPDGALAVIALAVLACVATALGGGLQVPWDGVLPFAVLGLALLVLAPVLPRGRAALRLFAPFAIVYLAYRALRGALPALVDHGVEPTLRAADEALLGASPAWALSAIHAPWLTEVLAYAYATMFLLPLAVLVGLLARRADRAVRQVAFALQLAFYLGFVGFLVVPARSPDIVYVFETPLAGHGFFEASMRAWRSLQAVTYDAFPSMHTAISTIALVYAVRLRCTLAPAAPWVPVVAMAPIVALLQLATLYLRQHYFVDLLGGWAVAALAVIFAERVLPYRR